MNTTIYTDKDGRRYYRAFPVKSLLRSTTVYEITMRGDWLVLDTETGQLTVKNPKNLTAETLDDYTDKHKITMKAEYDKGYAEGIKTGQDCQTLSPGKLANARIAGRAMERAKTLSLTSKIKLLIKEWEDE